MGHTCTSKHPLPPQPRGVLRSEVSVSEESEVQTPQFRKLWCWVPGWFQM